MSSSFQIQVTNLMTAMAGAIASNAVAAPRNQELVDCSPNTSNNLECRIQQLPYGEDAASVEYLRSWLPSVDTLVANLDLAAHKQSTENCSIRDFGNFVAQLESPSASAFETYDLYQIRLSLSERSLTYADFRHAVDHQVDYASSTWQNN